MKRLLFAVLAFLLTCSYASADILSSYTWTDAYNNIEWQYQHYTSNPTIISNLKTYYTEHLQSSYNYYYIYADGLTNSGDVWNLCLAATNDSTVYGFQFQGTSGRYRFLLSSNVTYCYVNYPNGEYILTSNSGSHDTLDWGIGLLETSSPFAYSSSVPQGYDDSSAYIYYQNLNFPALSSTNFDILPFSITDNNPVPTIMSLYDGTYDPTPIIGYTEINLNNYAYVALSLKNYNQPSFSTLFYVQGQLCLTPVYDFGMKEKVTYFPGYQVQGCTPYYTDYTPSTVYIIDSDLQNNAIYYLKAFDTSRPNLIKVDSSVFDITPITSANANSPYVSIGGRTYPTIPYDSLSSSATKSEEEGYISGQVVSPFDAAADSSFIDGLFSNPLNALSDAWAAIIAIFSLIGSFISLLPVALQSFLYTALALGLSIGLIKIIL